VAQRLFLPEGWFPDPYAARRARCNVPKARAVQSKPQLAAARLQAIVREGRLPCTSVVADGLYGQRLDLLDAMETCVGVTACVALPAETRCWLQRPQPEEKADT
jgi:SRSO17 transposase